MKRVVAGPPGAGGPDVIDASRWYYRYGYVALGRLLSAYHRTRVHGAERIAHGPCIYVAHHGAGYLTFDLVVACYEVGWRAWHERRGPRIPLRIVASRDHAMERAIPGLRLIKRRAGLIDPSEPSCLAVLARGEQLLITPGGQREARPGAREYRLRWADRYGFVRLALATGVPIVPLAVVGGFAAYPGRSHGKLTFWSPVPLPVRLDVALGPAIAIPRSPDAARNLDVVRGIHAHAWSATQSLYDDLLAVRRGHAGPRA